MTKRKFVLTFIALFFLNSISQAESPGKALKIACVGDSITFGAAIKDRQKMCYPAQMARTLGKKAIVKNFGVNGATLLKKGDKPYWKLKQYKAALTFSPDIVIIKLGTNDSKPKNWKHKAEYTADYVELIQSFQKLPSKPKVWICYPVPAYPGRWGITDRVMKQEVIPLIDEVAKISKVEIIDLYKALSGKKDLFPDSVHPNAGGAQIIAETILPIITK